MHRRLIASAVGGVVGLGLAYRFQDIIGVSQTVALTSCAAVGMAIAWVASMLFDVFAGSAHSSTTPE
jgi:hypothetical protein